MSEKKKDLILYAAIFFVTVIVALVCIKQLRKNTYPYCEMPRVVFSYHNNWDDVYVFDAEGDIYKISRDYENAKGLLWLEPTIACLEKGQEEPWLEKVGTTDKAVLQEKYNIFRKVTANPKFAVFCTETTIPNDENPNAQYNRIYEHFYGHITNSKGMCFYQTGYLKYDVTDKTIYQVVDWIRDEVNKCEKREFLSSSVMVLSSWLPVADERRRNRNEKRF